MSEELFATAEGTLPMKSQNHTTDLSIESIPQQTFSAEKLSKSKPKKRASRKSGKLKKQEKIRRLVVNYGNKAIPISFKQIARKVDCTQRYAEITIAKLVEAGKIMKTTTKFISKKYTKERVLCGKNIYTSPPKAKPKSTESSEILNEKGDAKIRNKSKIFNKLKIAKGTTLRNSSKEEIFQEILKKEEKVSFLKPLGFENLVETSPDWWYRDLELLKKSLRLLKQKLKTGWKCRDQIKFITFLLKHGTFGYRHHCARNLSLAINRPTLDRIEPYMASEYVANGYEALKELHKKHNLDITFSNVQKLLRKGFSHLAMSADVMLKRLKIPGVRENNAFLHHIVSMKEPVDVLRKKTA